MSTTVAWSPNLRMAVKQFKELKTIADEKSSHEYVLTIVEEQALLRSSSLQRSASVNRGIIWY